jgi:hypothetical protein
MKNTDIAMIVFIAAISVVLSYFISNAILGDPNDKVENISYIDVISDEIEDPDAETFNTKAFNPTVEVYVGRCGPLEVWNPTKLVCEPADGSGSSEKEDTPVKDETDDSGDSSSDDSGDLSSDDSGVPSTPAGDE